MAMTSPTSPSSIQIHRFPQNQYVDAARWVAQLSTFNRQIVLAAFDPDSSTPSLQSLGVTLPSNSHISQNPPELTPLSSISVSSRISCLKSSQFSDKSIIAASTVSGSLLIFSAELLSGSLDLEASVPEKGFHFGPILGIDLSEIGSECVSVGEDGRINLAKIRGGDGITYQRIFDSNGLISYSAVKWASPVEFVTGGLGFSLQWWDQRRPGGPVSQFKGNWSRGATSGIIHSVDIHPSRKHTCLAGGSSGAVFAWDLRWQNQPIILSGVGNNDPAVPSLSESEIWEVQYDNYTHLSNIGNISSSHILPAIICSEDGILAVMEQGEEPFELLAEPCAINSFDIDRQKPSDVLCSLEWESIAILTRL